MPNSAKLEELSYQHIEYTEKADCIMKCRNITDAEIKQVMKSGKVNYTLSDVHHKPYPTYTIEGPTGTKRNLRIVIEQHGCLAEVIVPGSVIREARDNLQLKEFLQNSMVDLYARLAYMHRKNNVDNNINNISKEQS